jgi:hypothetical protein
LQTESFFKPLAVKHSSLAATKHVDPRAVSSNIRQTDEMKGISNASVAQTFVHVFFTGFRRFLSFSYASLFLCTYQIGQRKILVMSRIV